jgi:hypothetical protein
MNCGLNFEMTGFVPGGGRRKPGFTVVSELNFRSIFSTPNHMTLFRRYLSRGESLFSTLLMVSLDARAPHPWPAMTHHLLCNANVKIFTGISVDVFPWHMKIKRTRGGSFGRARLFLTYSEYYNFNPKKTYD